MAGKDGRTVKPGISLGRGLTVLVIHDLSVLKAWMACTAHMSGKDGRTVKPGISLGRGLTVLVIHDSSVLKAWIACTAHMSGKVGRTVKPGISLGRGLTVLVIHHLSVLKNLDGLNRIHVWKRWQNCQTWHFPRTRFNSSCYS